MISPSHPGYESLYCEEQGLVPRVATALLTGHLISFLFWVYGGETALLCTVRRDLLMYRSITVQALSQSG